MLTPIGPGNASCKTTGPIQGYLKVFSATTEYCNNSGGIMYYPHTRYSILNTDGSRYKWVDNHASDTNESPETVALPAGNYYVLAQSELGGPVKVPVLIKGGQTTVVNLEKGRSNLDPATRANHNPLLDPSFYNSNHEISS
jgi:hypothetical protein